MATLVSFHAHPDDESIIAGRVVRRAADQGHRVVLVFGTRGELGEVEDGFLDEGEPFWQRRVAETLASAEILGAARTEFLGYVDSGMMGEPTNDNPNCFWQAPVEDAATRLAELLREEWADVLTVYDDNGGYGHPDHIQVHRVGRAGGRSGGTSRGVPDDREPRLLMRGLRTVPRSRPGAAGIEIPEGDRPPGRPGQAGKRDHRRLRRFRPDGGQARVDAGARQPDRRELLLPHDARGGVPIRLRHRVGDPDRAGSRDHRDGSDGRPVSRHFER